MAAAAACGHRLPGRAPGPDAARPDLGARARGVPLGSPPGRRTPSLAGFLIDGGEPPPRARGARRTDRGVRRVRPAGGAGLLVECRASGGLAGALGSGRPGRRRGSRRDPARPPTGSGAAGARGRLAPRAAPGRRAAGPAGGCDRRGAGPGRRRRRAVRQRQPGRGAAPGPRPGDLRRRRPRRGSAGLPARSDRVGRRLAGRARLRRRVRHPRLGRPRSSWACCRSSRSSVPYRPRRCRPASWWPWPSPSPCWRARGAAGGRRAGPRPTISAWSAGCSTHCWAPSSPPACSACSWRCPPARSARAGWPTWAPGRWSSPRSWPWSSPSARCRRRRG